MWRGVWFYREKGKAGGLSPISSRWKSFREGFWLSALDHRPKSRLIPMARGVRYYDRPMLGPAVSSMAGWWVGKCRSFQRKGVVFSDKATSIRFFSLLPAPSLLGGQMLAFLFLREFLMSSFLPLLPKVRGSVAAVEERLRGWETLLPWSGLSEGTGSSSNTPEETDDVDNSNLDASSSASVAPWAGPATSLLPTENGEGRLRVIMGREADSSSEACIGPEPPKDGKLAGGQSAYRCSCVCPQLQPIIFSFCCPHSLLHLVIQPFTNQPVFHRETWEASLTPPSP